LKIKIHQRKISPDCTKKEHGKTWDRFRKHSNLYKIIICTAKILYYGKEFTKSKKNIKQTWNLANEVTGRNT
jgi:hypothetical protein